MTMPRRQTDVLLAILAAACGLTMLVALLAIAGAVGPALPVRPAKSYANDRAFGGSCLWRACEDMLAANGREEEAEFWYRQYFGGACAADAAAVARARGLCYRDTYRGDEQFLAECSDAGLAAAIHWPASHSRRCIHAVSFLGFDADDGGAWILDNNDPDQLQKIPREKFLAAWRSAGGAAICILPPEF
jgi:hypothetical protein